MRGGSPRQCAAPGGTATSAACSSRGHVLNAQCAPAQQLFTSCDLCAGVWHSRLFCMWAQPSVSAHAVLCTGDFFEGWHKEGRLAYGVYEGSYW
jgi:hypothetical protein